MWILSNPRIRQLGRGRAECLNQDAARKALAQLEISRLYLQITTNARNSSSQRHRATVSDAEILEEINCELPRRGGDGRTPK